LKAGEATTDDHDAVRKADTMAATELGHSAVGSAVERLDRVVGREVIAWE
jgi:hypothetical protein